MNLSAMKGYYYSSSTLPEGVGAGGCVCAVSFLIKSLTWAGHSLGLAHISSFTLLSCFLQTS